MLDIDPWTSIVNTGILTFIKGGMLQQRFLETQTQLLHKLTDQMINMGNNSSQGVYDNNDVKDDIIEGTQACNVCGDKGHTSKEHEDQCPNCEEKHPTNQCPTSQATSFLCEGNNHVPIQCPI